jgi:hypothetical protein
LLDGIRKGEGRTKGIAKEIYRQPRHAADVVHDVKETPADLGEYSE